MKKSRVEKCVETCAFKRVNFSNHQQSISISSSPLTSTLQTKVLMEQSMRRRQTNVKVKLAYLKVYFGIPPPYGKMTSTLDEGKKKDKRQKTVNQIYLLPADNFDWMDVLFYYIGKCLLFKK